MIFHIPHASAHIPPEQLSQIILPAELLRLKLLKVTDWFTDELFGCHANPSDTVVGFSVSRLVVDPKRFVKDSEEPMASVGMGVIYTKASDGSQLRAIPTANEREHLINTYYHPHHQRLTEAVEAEIKRNGRALILDCHSFPSEPLPYELDQTPNRPDICIGSDEYHTPARLVEAIEVQCRAEGISFAVNRPFAGFIVPFEHYKTTPNVLSIMIEVNRDGLDERLLNDRGIEMIAPHRKKRRKQCTQHGRKLRRYTRRWKVERLFAWLQNFRRLVVRYEYHADNFLGMVQLGCAIILLRVF